MWQHSRRIPDKRQSVYCIKIITQNPVNLKKMNMCNRTERTYMCAYVRVYRHVHARLNAPLTVHIGLESSVIKIIHIDSITHFQFNERAIGAQVSLYTSLSLGLAWWTMVTYLSARTKCIKRMQTMNSVIANGWTDCHVYSVVDYYVYHMYMCFGANVMIECERGAQSIHSIPSTDHVHTG